MNEFFGIRDAFSLFLFHSSRIPGGKKFERKKGAHISEKNVEIERGMGFIEVSWILWAFETRPLRLSFKFLFRRVFEDQVSFLIKSLDRLPAV